MYERFIYSASLPHIVFWRQEEWCRQGFCGETQAIRDGKDYSSLEPAKSQENYGWMRCHDFVGILCRICQRPNLEAACQCAAASAACSAARVGVVACAATNSGPVACTATANGREKCILNGYIKDYI